MCFLTTYSKYSYLEVRDSNLDFLFFCVDWSFQYSFEDVALFTKFKNRKLCHGGRKKDFHFYPYDTHPI